MTNAEARFNKSHIRKVYACLAVTCHLHFWQNDRDFLRATVVTRGWNGYRNKSQHKKSTLEKKILPPFQQGFEPATFQSRVRRSNHWAIPAPEIETAENHVIGVWVSVFVSGLCVPGIVCKLVYQSWTYVYWVYIYIGPWYKQPPCSVLNAAEWKRNSKRNTLWVWVCFVSQ